MRILKIENDLVVNVGKHNDNEPVPSGWIASPDESVSVGFIQNLDGGFSHPSAGPRPLSPKDVRDQALASLVHDFGDGRVIQCRPHPFSDESNMRNAIDQMARLGQQSRLWYSANDTPVNVTADELRVVINSGQDQTAQVWEQFFQAMST